MSRSDKPLVVTAGEPAGIGPELCLAVAAEAAKPDFVVVSDAELLRERAGLLDIPVHIRSISTTELDGWRPAPGELSVLNIPFAEPVSCGIPKSANAGALLDGLRLAGAECSD